jgi:hypothetical protein
MKISLEALIDILQYNKKRTIIVLVIISTLILLLTLIFSWKNNNFRFSFPSMGKIHTINVNVQGGDLKYMNGEPTLDWGVVYPGLQVNRTFYVTSKSNIEGTLTIKVVNLTFSNTEAFTYNKTDWMKIVEPSCNKTTIKPKETILVTLTLNVSNSNDFVNWIIENNIKSFNFDIHIYVKEIP